MDVGSNLMPDLKASRPDSSSTWHLAPLALRGSKVEIVIRMRRVVVKMSFILFFLHKDLRMGEIV
jgi:hypothetical protein